MTAPYLTILGTGNALATRCYNTCFTLHGADGEILLVDAGGGNGILTQLVRAEIDLPTIRDLFITHTHTDHQPKRFSPRTLAYLAKKQYFYTSK